MPKLFPLYEEKLKNKDEQTPAASAEPGSREEYTQQIANQQKEQQNENQNLELPDNITGDQQENRYNEEEAYSQYKLGATSSVNARELEANPDAWSPEYTDELFLEEAGQSFMRGVGNYVIKGLGDMIQVASAPFTGSISQGNMLSRALQAGGTEFANMFMDHMPEHLKHENLTWGSAADPQFWSQTVAEMVPQLLEFIFLSKGGGALAKKAGKSLLKKADDTALGSATKTALNKEVAGTGKGLVGKLATDQGLTGLGHATFDAIGGGITSNMMAGLMNAADVVNSNKDLVDDQGNPLYSEDELKAMAAGTFKRNLQWIGVDMASFGMTYGGGWKQLKNLNPLAKGGKSYSRLQQSKIASKLFSYDVAPILKGLGRVGKKAAFEGLEETFQESWEEWAKKKAVEDVTGEPTGYDDFMDFYMSEENEGTKVVSAALGALGGGAFNIRSLVNKAADDNLRLRDRLVNFKEIVDKQGTEADLTAQEYFRRDTLANIVIDGKEDLYNDFRDYLVENGNITEEEAANMDTEFESYKQMNEKAEKLNVKGRKALLYNESKRSYADHKINEFTEIAKENIAEIEALDVEESVKKARIAEEKKNLQTQLRAMSMLKAETEQNIANLMVGKKAKPIEMEVVLDEFGNEMVVGGLSTQQYNEYVLGKGQSLQDDIDNLGKRSKKKKAKDVLDQAQQKAEQAKQTAVPVLSKLSKKAREVYDKAVGTVFGKEETAQETEQAETEGQEASGTTTVDGKEVQTPKTEQEATAEAQQMQEDVTIDDNETISDEVWDRFQQSGKVDGKLLNEIADKIYTKGELTNREDAIREKFEGDVRARIVNNLIGQENSQDAVTDPEKAAEQAKQTAEQQERQAETDAELSDDQLTDEDKAFISEEAKQKVKKGVQTASEFVKKKAAQAEKAFKKAKSRINPKSDGMDSRAKKPAIAAKNQADIILGTKVRDGLRKRTSSTENQISQNKLDNYLNSFSAYNEHGPSDLDTMVVVNHALKRMFPNTNSPAQLVVVRNLMDSIGSIGMASVVGSTIYIDRKSPNQNRLFMHEMSHIWYRLSHDEPFTQSLRSKVIGDEKLMNRIKQLYADYEIFRDYKGNEHKRGDLQRTYLKLGYDANAFEEVLKAWEQKGAMKSVPLAEQRLWIEEAFVATLEGPLDARFDKVFSPQGEPRRQRATKMWWGILRKKGEIIESDNMIDRMLNKMTDEVPEGNATLEDYFKKVFATVTEGVRVDSYGLDARADQLTDEQLADIAEIQAKKIEQIANYDPGVDLPTEQNDDIDSEIESLESFGDAFFNNDFQSRIRKARKILRHFGNVYNKSLRIKYLKDTRDQRVDRKKQTQDLFNRDLFDTLLFNLATENPNSNEFIRQIENSNIQEIQAFNRFLNKIHPNSKYAILNSMHFVFGNAKHIVGFRNVMDNNGNYRMTDSLSQRELSMIDQTIENMHQMYEGDPVRWSKFKSSVNRIRNERGTQEDFYNVFHVLSGDMFYSGLTYPSARVLEQGMVTYQGQSIPIEQLLYHTIKRGDFHRKGQNGEFLSVYNTRPIVAAIQNTARKFSPRANVLNAENEMEPVRIVNNHLTKEFDDMVDFLATQPTKEKFIARYSHIGHKTAKDRGKAYVPNMLLSGIYDRYMEEGILPTISQYHGIENYDQKEGSLYKDSTALEQNLEDFLTFVNSSTAANGRRKKSYLGNVGAFADSPRKFFINMPRVDINRVFNTENGFSWKADGIILNNIFGLHNAMYNDEISGNKKKMKASIIDAINFQVKLMNDNANEMMRISVMKPYYNNQGRLNKAGKLLVAEYTINSILNGYNVNDTFLPGIGKKNVVKRFKMNSSPVMDAKNPNFKFEPIYVSDEIANQSIAGTDSAWFILQEDADKLGALGKGVFDMNHGFKLLNASVEKTNPNFKGKTAYLKGYTTIVDENHPFYPVLKSRKEKYNAWHKEKYGTDPSIDLSNGEPNHIAVIIPESADKSKFFGKKLVDDTNWTYTEEGAKRTPEALMKNYDVITEENDRLYYDKNGDFVGLETYNFGPQQVMDKSRQDSTLPVQMVNSIMVNAAINGRIDEAVEIQQLIAEAKQENLLEELQAIADADPEAYRQIVMDNLNTQDMDQAQRFMLEDDGSISHPYMNTIATNQLAKQIRRKGNQLSTDGTYAHQKPDLGARVEGGKLLPGLKGYRKKANGQGNLPAEAVVPKSISGKVSPRRHLSMESHADMLRDVDTMEDSLKALRRAAMAQARVRAKKNGGVAEDYISEYINENGIHTGYTVAGDRIIASRVPGHGPASTGVFEVVGIDEGDGNQVMVGSDFNEIIGSDNDGDALFIQLPGTPKKKWNKAFKGITQYWLSSEMDKQVQTTMDFVDEVSGVVENVAKQFPQATKYVMPFSPEQKFIDYNNTMVSKRNVGPVFNIHKIANLLAAYEIPMSKSININKEVFERFQDDQVGQQSRNQRSATLANIILDNTKYGFADSLGLNEYNVPHATLLINLGVSLDSIGRILNSPAAKIWADLQRKNASMFHYTQNNDNLIAQARKKLGIKKNEKFALKINTGMLADPKNKGQQGAVIELLRYLSEMNNEVASISGLMSGHNRIHVNPLVLEKQIEDFRKLVSEKSDTEKILNLSDKFLMNPDLKNYLFVAETTLKHMKNVNPVYRDSTLKLLEQLSDKIDQDMSTKQLEAISADINLFNTARLLGHNNITKERVVEIMDPSNEKSVYAMTQQYLKELAKVQVDRDSQDNTRAVTGVKNSLLFSRALSYRLRPTSRMNVYISANSDFVNDSFSQQERKRVQEEFGQLPGELQDALIIHDLVRHGWKGPRSIAPFFPDMTNWLVNMSANDDSANKNTTISPKIINELERVIALKMSQERSNPFQKVRVKGNTDPDNLESAKQAIFPATDTTEAQEVLLGKISKAQPMYIVVRNNKKSALYEIPAFTNEEIAEMNSERTLSQKRIRAQMIAKKNLRLIPNDLTRVGNKPVPNIDIAMIADKNIPKPYRSFDDYTRDASLDDMIGATISFEQFMENLEQSGGMDAREDFDEEIFTREQPLSREEFDTAMEYEPYMSETLKKDAYAQYEKDKAEANQEAKTVLPQVEQANTEELLSLYEKYGEKPIYAYSVILTPIVKRLATNLAADQAALFKKNKVEGKAEGSDISAFKSYMMTGSTIPSDHPAAQGLTRMLEQEYKKFINEKKKYMKRLNDATDALYKEKLGYGAKRTLKNVFGKIKSVFSYVITGTDPYQALYGNLVQRKERINEAGTLVYDYKLRPQNEIEDEFKKGWISQAEKDFYDTFRAISDELRPDRIKKFEKDYIPHTSMSRLEAFGSRGLLGLMINSRPEDNQIYNVKLYHKNHEGEDQLMSFKQIEDLYKMQAAQNGNRVDDLRDYRKIRRKAKSLLAKGQNENGSKILADPAEIHTALGFGAINRFASNRSVRATEMPSMDLNKAMSDYIHSSLFVDGNANFRGMRTLQGYIDGVLAHNRQKGFHNMNNHVQKVWKDHFLRNRRQESFAGKNVDRVVLGLTRLNLFYALGYSANKNTGGLYAVGNILAGKYHNIKDLGGKKWIQGELRYWGLDKGFEGGIEGVIKRHKRMQRIMKSMNFMDINVYDEVQLEKKSGLDTVFSDLALMPMIASENWIQRVHMLGLLTDEELDRYDENGHANYMVIPPERLTELEDRVKASHGRGYQPTDQRAIQLYSWGTMMLQFSRFIPTMMNDRFAKEDVNIYGRKNIGTLTAVGKMMRYVANNPKDFVAYRKSLNEQERQRLDAGLRGVAMSTIISLLATNASSESAGELFWDSNYYWDHDRLLGKLVPAPIRTMDNLTNSMF